MMPADKPFSMAAIPPSVETKRRVFAFGALTTVLLVIYANSFRCGWHLDDYHVIVDNPAIHAKSLDPSELRRSLNGIGRPKGRLSRPLAYLSFALNYRFGQDRVWGYHAVNFAIHLAASWLLFILLMRLMTLPALAPRCGRQRYAIALLATFLWATHPMQVSAVTYIVQRMAAMAALFYLASLYSYVRLRTCRGGVRRFFWISGCILFALMALASKENAVMLPAALLLCEWLLLSGTGGPNAGRPFPALVAVFILVGAAALWMLGRAHLLDGYATRPFDLSQRLMTEPRVLLFYLSLLLYPLNSRLTLIHDIPISPALTDPWTTWAAILLLVALALTAILLRRRFPLIAFSILFFLLNHVVESSFLPLEIVFEHRNYLPSLFFFVPLSILALHVLEYFRTSRPIVALIITMLAVVISAHGHTVYLRNEAFNSDLTLWRDNVSKAPGLHRPHHNLAKALMIAGHKNAALGEMELALQARPSARINQKYITYYNLALYDLDADHPRRALCHLRRALALCPGDPLISMRMGQANILQGRLADAQFFLSRSLATDPDLPAALVLWGWVCLRADRNAEALAAARRAQHIADRDASVYQLLGEICRNRQRLLSARFYFEKASQLSPQDPAALFALAELEYRRKNMAAAKHWAARALCTLGAEGLTVQLVRFDRRYNTCGKQRMRDLGAVFANYLQAVAAVGAPSPHAARSGLGPS